MIDTRRAADVYLEMVRQRSSVGQSGRFISARSLVRVQSLPPSERPPSECGARRAVGNSRVRRSRGRRAVSSVVRALASHARGPRFDPSTAHQADRSQHGVGERTEDAEVAELVDALHSGCSAHCGRVGSSPSFGTINHPGRSRDREDIRRTFEKRALVAQMERAHPCGG